MAPLASICILRPQLFDLKNNVIIGHDWLCTIAAFTFVAGIIAY